jgi:UDP-N-acetylglucosamine--N-acetylmuramyl-(pentapeptide) pyrophosphoryl-undecaprenol N-acetylglucosamine transferase
MKKIKALIAAGGTGGHLFPALAVVEEFKKIYGDDFEAFFVGNPNRLESRIVPEQGHSFTPIPITGFTGLMSSGLLTLPFKIMKSLSIVRGIIKREKPDFAICTGAYLSYPVGVAANQKRVPLVLMESNVFPGKTIRLLSSKADLIVSSFEETKKYFSVDTHKRIECLGNPLRKMFENPPTREQALEKFGLKPNVPTVLIFGGSLGARAINLASRTAFEALGDMNIQFIWQTGADFQLSGELPSNVKMLKFIDDMASAYIAADLVVARSGATTVAELSYMAKPSLLIPLPSASNNEQASNAEALKANGAAIIIDNSEVGDKLTSAIRELMNAPDKLISMANAADKLARRDAAEKSAQKIIQLIEKNKNK